MRRTVMPVMAVLIMMVFVIMSFGCAGNTKLINKATGEELTPAQYAGKMFTYVSSRWQSLNRQAKEVNNDMIAKNKAAKIVLADPAATEKEKAEAKEIANLTFEVHRVIKKTINPVIIAAHAVISSYGDGVTAWRMSGEEPKNMTGMYEEITEALGNIAGMLTQLGLDYALGSITEVVE